MRGRRLLVVRRVLLTHVLAWRMRRDRRAAFTRRFIGSFDRAVSCADRGSSRHVRSHQVIFLINREHLSTSRRQRCSQRFPCGFSISLRRLRPSLRLARFGSARSGVRCQASGLVCLGNILFN